MQVFYLKVIHNLKIYGNYSTNFAMCNATQKFISSISAIRPAILSRVRYAVRLQMIYTTFRHVEWVEVKMQTALKTLWPYAENIMKCMGIGNNGKIGCKRCMI